MWVCADTHIGQKREENQDTFVVSNVADGVLAVVCDGMGGAAGGKIASRIAADTMAERVGQGLRQGAGEASVRRILESAGAASNVAVRDAVSHNRALEGMGTTLVCAVVANGEAHFAHAGDSRAYLLREGFLTQLTVDHTLVQMLIRRGDITTGDAQKHPHRHYLTRAVGMEDDIRLDIFSIDITNEDALLLCTDGLYNYVHHEDLCNLANLGVKTKSVDLLIDKANQNGGGDNITAVLIGLEGGEQD